MTTKYYILGIMLFFSCAVCSPSWAVLKDTNIKSTRTYLDDYGLSTLEWQLLWGSDFFASSPFKEIGSGFPKTNNMAYLAYTIDGNINKAEKLTLVLRVNNKAMARAAHEEMLKAAIVLAKKALGTALPEVISRAIIQGNNANIKVGNTSIKLIRADWSTGMGYDLKVLFE